MSKFIVQLRRGTKAEWQSYEQQEDHLKPFAGELVVEYDNGIPRLKIGDGTHEFSQLEYMSVDSFLLPKPTTITLLGGNNWIQDVDEDNVPISDRYHQVVTINNGVVTPNSKIDLQPSPEQLSIFHKIDVSFTAVNENGVVTVYAVGEYPKNTYTIQVTITEVITNE